MGAQATIEKKKNFIHPVPGTFGAPIKRKNHLTIYSDDEIIQLQFSPTSTVK